MEGELGESDTRAHPHIFYPRRLTLPTIYDVYGSQHTAFYTGSDRTRIPGSHWVALSHRCTTSSGTIANDRMRIAHKFSFFFYLLLIIAVFSKTILLTILNCHDRKIIPI